jgi:hypothetical protein
MYSELGVGWCSYDASTGVPPVRRVYFNLEVRLVVRIEESKQNDRKAAE